MAPPRRRAGIRRHGYLWDDGRPVAVAGDEDDEGPVVGVHEDAGRLRAGRVEGRGAAAVRALHAAAAHLPQQPLPAVRTLLLKEGGGGGEERKRATDRQRQTV